MSKRISKGDFIEHNAQMIVKNPKVVTYRRCGEIFKTKKSGFIL